MDRETRLWSNLLSVQATPHCLSTAEDEMIVMLRRPTSCTPYHLAYELRHCCLLAILNKIE